MVIAHFYPIPNLETQDGVTADPRNHQLSRQARNDVLDHRDHRCIITRPLEQCCPWRPAAMNLDAIKSVLESAKTTGRRQNAGVITWRYSLRLRAEPAT